MKHVLLILLLISPLILGEKFSARKANKQNKLNIVNVDEAEDLQPKQAFPIPREQAPMLIGIDWIELIGSLLGGLCIFMFGSRMLSQALKNAAGDSLKEALAGVANNRFLATMTGVVAASLLQSSALVSVMVVSFVSSGFMTFYQSIGILLGAGIGTTVTSQLVAFNVSKYTFVLLAVGFFMTAFSKSVKSQHYGTGIFGLGMTFQGIATMSKSMIPLRSYPPFVEMLVSLSNPVLGIFVGAVFTALIQSSAAAVGVIQVLGGQHLITLRSAVCLVLGSNIGTAVTSILAAIGTNKEAQRVAFLNIMLKVVGVAFLLPFLSPLERILENTSSDASRQVANAHTFFNVASAFIFIPFSRQIANVVSRMIPGQVVED